MFVQCSQTQRLKARWSSGLSRQVDDPIGLPLLREPEVCEATGHKNAQPTHPERNAQAADLHLPSKDDPQQMHYRHDEKQCRRDGHIGSSVQSACLSASQPTTLDSSLRLRVARCLVAFWRGRVVRRPSTPTGIALLPPFGAPRLVRAGQDRNRGCRV